MADLNQQFDALPDAAVTPQQKSDLNGQFDKLPDAAPQVPPANETVQTMKDFGRGIAQGATLGFADELAGLGEAGLDILKDPSKAAQAYQLYRQHQQESQTAFNAAKQRSPWAYGIGQVGGAIAPALLTAGGSAEAQGATLLGKMASSGARFGTMGALAGVGNSQNTIEQPGALLADAGKDAALGAAMGAGGTALAAAPGYLASKFPALNKVASSFQRGAEGTNLVGEAGQMNAQQNALNEAKNLADQLQQHQLNLGQGFEQAQVEKAIAGANPTSLSKDYYNFHEGLRQMNLENAVNPSEKLHTIMNQMAGSPRQQVVTQDKVNAALQFIKQSNPELADSMGKTLQSAAKDIQIAKSAQMPTDLKSLLDIKGNTMALSNLAGQVKYGVDNSVLGKLMTTAPKNTGANMLLFNMLQNPTTRELFHDENNPDSFQGNNSGR